MRAAVVTSFDEPPHYLEVPDPASGAARVLAVGLHPRVRSGAAGRHYSSRGTLPLTPGVDGVARRTDGTLVYFVADDTGLGSMADLVTLDPRRSVELPPDVDVLGVAATMNPAMSSWVALRRRIRFTPGAGVLVLGATGAAGSLAVRVARQLGAGQVIAAGRNSARLNGAGADEVCELGADLAEHAAAVDVVLDYLWGEPTEAALEAVLNARQDPGRALDWIQIGSVAGPTIRLPSAALRSRNLRLLGSGQGSIGTQEYLGELPALADQIDAGAIRLDPVLRALADVESAWAVTDAPGTRTVLVP